MVNFKPKQFVISIKAGNKPHEVLCPNDLESDAITSVGAGVKSKQRILTCQSLSNDWGVRVLGFGFSLVCFPESYCVTRLASVTAILLPQASSHRESCLYKTLPVQ